MKAICNLKTLRAQLETLHQTKYTWGSIAKATGIEKHHLSHLANNQYTTLNLQVAAKLVTFFVEQGLGDARIGGSPTDVGASDLIILVSTDKSSSIC